METISDVTLAKGACPITNFVITLGEKMLQEKVRDWLTMEETADFCRDHGLELDGACPASATLETRLRKFFKATGEFYALGINVDAYERQKGWEKPFQIRAYVYSSANQNALTGSLESEVTGEEAQNPDIANIGYKASILPSSNSHLP